MGKKRSVGPVEQVCFVFCFVLFLFSGAYKMQVAHKIAEISALGKGCTRLDLSLAQMFDR